MVRHQVIRYYDCIVETEVPHVTSWSQLASCNAGLAPGSAGAPPAGTTKGEPAFRTAHNDWLKPGPSTAGAGATALTRVDAQPDRAMTVRRGGFGATSASRSGSFGG